MEITIGDYKLYRRDHRNICVAKNDKVIQYHGKLKEAIVGLLRELQLGDDVDTLTKLQESIMASEERVIEALEGIKI